MSDIDLWLKKGIAAVQAGELEEARSLLKRVLAEEPRNEQAWLWLSAAVDDVRERKECLRRALEINPDNAEAWRSLNALALSPLAPKTQEGVAPRTGAREIPCPSCGSDMRYSVRHRALACPYCGKVVDIPKDSTPPKSYPLWGLPATREAQQEWVGVQVYQCQDCGASTTFSTRRGSLKCPFCGSYFLVKPPSGVPLISPQALIPFQLEEEEAETALRRWLERGWLRPGDLARRAAVERLHGVYIPFWVFNGLGKVRWRDVEGRTRKATQIYGDVPICGSLSLTAEMARDIEPFEFEALIAYRPEYLAGWPAEVYQIALVDASLEARGRLMEEAEKRFGRVEQVDFIDLNWKLALLPVYVGMYRYQGRLFPFAVNGQTGQAYAKAPYSPVQVRLAVASGVLFVVMLILVVIRLWPHLSSVFGSLSINIEDLDIENTDIDEIIKEIYNAISKLIKFYIGG